MNQLLYTTKIPIWDGFTTCLSKIIKQNILFKEYNQIINTFKDNNENDILKLFEIDEYNRILIKNSLIESYNSIIFNIRNDVHESSYFYTFCCIILNYSSMANNIHIKIYHQNINKYIIKE